MVEQHIFDVVAGVAAVSLIYIFHKFRTNNQLPLPPGPKGYPLIGNIFDMPAKVPWERWHELCKEHKTDILYLNIVGQNIIVLDSAEAAMELLERRSSIYSDRPRLPMLRELMEVVFNVATEPYGHQWRSQRKLMHHVFHPTAAKQFRPQTQKAARTVLRKLLEKPEGVDKHLRLMAGETIVTITYGLEVKDENDSYIQISEDCVRMLSETAVPGAFLVDALPILKYVPEWMPGAGFQKKAQAGKNIAQALLEVPFKASKGLIDAGKNPPSFVSNCSSDVNEGEDVAWQEYLIKATAASMYIAGTDTTVMSILWCLIGCLNHPDILKRAQEEIDSVIPFGELPTFDDEDKLPIITAMCMESLRWKDVLPIAIPHTLTEEDVYKGYRLPKGSIVIGNAWAMLHDEQAYPDPFSFKPERFLKDGKINKDVRDPAHAAFGFGRRVCPGRFMAFSAIWITLSSLIAAFDISKAVDENGKEIPVEAVAEDLLTPLSIPTAFKCSIKPRSPKHEQAIQATSNEEYQYGM